MNCKKCLLSYDREIRIPKMLSCGHTLCLACLRKMPSLSSGLSSFLCPICKKLTVKSEHGFESLPTVIDLIPDRGQGSRAIKCNNPKHSTEDVKIFCQSCSEAVCGLCVTLKHRDTNLHDLCDIEEGIDFVKGQMKSCIEKLLKRKTHIDAQKENMEDLVCKSAMNCIDTRNNVEETYNEIVRIAQEQKQQMTEKIDNLERTHRQKNMDILGEMEMASQRCQGMINQAKSALESNDFHKLNTAIQQAQNLPGPHNFKLGYVTYLEITEATKNKKYSIIRNFGSVNEWSVSPAPIPEHISMFTLDSKDHLSDIAVTDSGNIVLRVKTGNSFTVTLFDQAGGKLQTTKKSAFTKPLRFCNYPSDSQKVLILDKTQNAIELKLWDVNLNSVSVMYKILDCNDMSYGLTLSGIFTSSILVSDQSMQLLQEVRSSGIGGDAIKYSRQNIKYIAGHVEEHDIIVLNENFCNLVGMRSGKEIWTLGTGTSDEEKYRGMVMDSQGCFMVIDAQKQSILRLSPNGKEIQTVLVSEDKLSSLAGLDYNEKAHIMATVDKSTGKVNVYKM